MGLDQKIMVASKPNDGEVEFLRNHYVSQSPLTCFDIAELKEQGEYGLVAELEPYSVVVRAKNKEFDEKLLREEFGVPEDAVLFNTEYDRNGLTYVYFDREKNADGTRNKYHCLVPPAKLDHYDVESEHEYLVCDLRTIATLRKHYAVQNAAYAHTTAQNCGYAVMDDDAIAAIEECGIDLNGYETTDEQAVVYWEWF